MHFPHPKGSVVSSYDLGDPGRIPSAYAYAPSYQESYKVSPLFSMDSGADGCATGLQTRSRHVCESIFRVLTTRYGSATAFGGAFAQSNGSRLFTLKLRFISQSSGVVFNIAGLGKFFTERAGFPCSSRCGGSFCPPFGGFQRAVPRFLLPPELSAPCWCTVAAVHPLGDCDSSGTETFPGLLDSTRSGF
jgi:hypothetical protein